MNDADLRDAVILAVLDNPELGERIAEVVNDPEELRALLGNDGDADDIEGFAEHRPGLVQKKTRDKNGHEVTRWVRPDQAGGSETHAAPVQTPALEQPAAVSPIDEQALAKALPDVVGDPTLWQKVKGFAGKLSSTAGALVQHAMIQFGVNAEDILDVAADYSKIFYAGRGDGRGGSIDPFAQHFGVGANTVAVIASHVLPRLASAVRSKLGFAETSESSMAAAVAQIVVAIGQAAGVSIVPDLPTIQRMLTERKARK